MAKKPFNKYGNVKTTVDGILFDSKMEARFYETLKKYKEEGLIKDFSLQPRYLLQEAFRKNGKLNRKIEYVADFDIIHLDDTLETVDVKGQETSDFKIKRKLWDKKYPHKLSVITYSKIDGGWIELDELKVARKERKKEKEGGQ